MSCYLLPRYKTEKTDLYLYRPIINIRRSIKTYTEWFTLNGKEDATSVVIKFTARGQGCILHVGDPKGDI